MKINELFQSKKSLKAADLRDEQGKAKAVRVTIDNVTTQEFEDNGVKVVKPIIHFAGKEKTLVCNRTNALRIIEAVGSDESDTWIGWSITLYPTMVDGPKGRVDAIRVDDRPGASKAPAKPVRVAMATADAPDEHFDEPMPSDDDIPF